MVASFPAATLSITGCTISYSMLMKTSVGGPYTTLTPQVFEFLTGSNKL
jgi:hypothetical protein